MKRKWFFIALIGMFIILIGSYFLFLWKNYSSKNLSNQFANVKTKIVNEDEYDPEKEADYIESLNDETESDEQVSLEFKLGNKPDNVWNKKQVKDFYGEPLKIVKGNSDNREEWFYTDMKFYFFDESISRYSVISPKYPDFFGVKVGDSIDVLKKVFSGVTWDWDNYNTFYYEKWAKLESEGKKYYIIYHLNYNYDENKVITEIITSSEVD